jgi:hypothetical protein
MGFECFVRDMVGGCSTTLGKYRILLKIFIVGDLGAADNHRTMSLA